MSIYIKNNIKIYYLKNKIVPVIIKNIENNKLKKRIIKYLLNSFLLITLYFKIDLHLFDGNFFYFCKYVD